MTPRTLFKIFSIAELFTWAGLITALILRATGTADIVSIAGGIHGFIFLCYVATTIFVWVNQQWKPRVGVTGVALAIIPFATLPFELWADRNNLLDGTWRLAPGGETPQNFVEKIQALVLARPVVAAVGLLLIVSAVFTVLLILGPPIPQS